MRRHPEVIWREVDGRVVGLDLRTSRYFSLNQSAAFLWGELEGDVGADELAEALAARYGIDRGAAGADVAAFVEELRRSGLVEG